MKKPVEVPKKIKKNRPGIDNIVEKNRLYPILKWAGGKEQELKYIIPNLPLEFKNYYEPFVGGGAVYTAVHADCYFINDKSDELINLYRNLKNVDRRKLFSAVEEIIHDWDSLTKLLQDNSAFFIADYLNFSQNKIDEAKLIDLYYEFINNNSKYFTGLLSVNFNFNNDNFIEEIKTNLIRKSKRMKQLEQIKKLLPEKDILDNIETAFKSAFYMHIRHLYNYPDKYRLTAASKSAVFLFIRNFAYSGMFRYNSNGKFNVPYGGIAYNRKNFQKKIDYLRSKELKKRLEETIIENLDFEAFFKNHKPTKNDFVFLDPPYDSEFSTYAKNEFTRNDQERLAHFMINECEAKWMMIIKNTDFIFNLYNHKGLYINSFDKKYLVSFMNRNDKDVEHLIITNYKWQE